MLIKTLRPVTRDHKLIPVGSVIELPYSEGARLVWLGAARAEAAVMEGETVAAAPAAPARGSRANAGQMPAAATLMDVDASKAPELPASGVTLPSGVDKNLLGASD